MGRGAGRPRHWARPPTYRAFALGIIRPTNGGREGDQRRDGEVGAAENDGVEEGDGEEEGRGRKGGAGSNACSHLWAFSISARSVLRFFMCGGATAAAHTVDVPGPTFGDCFPLLRV